MRPVASFASVLLVDPRGWLLLQERDEHPAIDPERWGLPGGHLDPGELPLDAAVREVEEETGLVVAAADLLDCGTHDAGHGPATTYVAATTATDDDVVVGEGRRIVFVDPDHVADLPLTASAAAFLPGFLSGAVYARLHG